MLALENTFVFTVGTNHLITAAKSRCTLRKIAKQRYEIFAVRANGGDVPHSSSQSFRKHWGVSFRVLICRGPDGWSRDNHTSPHSNDDARIVILAVCPLADIGNVLPEQSVE